MFLKSNQETKKRERMTETNAPHSMCIECIHSPQFWLHMWTNKIHKSEWIGCSSKQFRALSCLSELTPIHQKCRSRLYMAPSINWNTPINFQTVDSAPKYIYRERAREIPTSISELRAACVSSVQSGIMHNAIPQLLTAGAHQIIYTCFYGHEELIFEAVPNEIPLGPNSILRECSGFLLGIRCIFIMQNTSSFKLHMWILVSSLF